MDINISITTVLDSSNRFSNISLIVKGNLKYIDYKDILSDDLTNYHIIIYAPDNLFGVDKLASDQSNLISQDTNLPIESPYHNNFIAREIHIKRKYIMVKEVFTSYRHHNFIYQLLKLWIAKITKFKFGDWTFFNFDIELFLFNLIASVLFKLTSAQGIAFSPLMVIKTILESLSITIYSYL